MEEKASGSSWGCRVWLCLLGVRWVGGRGGEVGGKEEGSERERRALELP